METDNCDMKTNTGRHRLRAYMLPLYVPTTMLVMIAWLAFFLDKKSTTARILLCVVSLTLIIAVSMAVNFRIPLTSYMKSTDVWIGVCLAYVFYALVESVIVSSGADSPRSRKNEYNQLDHKMAPAAAPSAHGMNLRSRLDSVSRLLYPLLFLVFVGWYVLRYAHIF
ncbi:GluCl alpha 3 [Aphelenchoides avenae]|nr:GluCl alpha 3 [Aphelenchus avenae]